MMRKMNPKNTKFIWQQFSENQAYTDPVSWCEKGSEEGFKQW